MRNTESMGTFDSFYNSGDSGGREGDIEDLENQPILSKQKLEVSAMKPFTGMMHLELPVSPNLFN